MEKNNFVWYSEWTEDLAYLDADDFKSIMFALTNYQTSGEIPDPDDIGHTLYCLFSMMTRRLDYNNESYNKAVERNRENGKKGGRPKKNPVKPTKTQENPVKPTETQNNPVKPTHNPEKPKKPELDIDMDIINNPPLSPLGGKPTASKLIEERHYPAQVEEAVKDWVKYKIEKRQSYKEVGLRNFLSMIENKLKGVPPDKVVECIRFSMANNWQGVVWDREQQTTKETKFNSFEQRDYDYAALEKKLFGG